MPEQPSAVTRAQRDRIDLLCHNLAIRPQPINNYYHAQQYIKYLQGRCSALKRQKALAAAKEMVKKNPLI